MPWIVAVALAAGRAEATPAAPAAPSTNTSEFWSEVIEPHAAEINRLVARARTLLERRGSDDEPATRLAVIGDAYGMLRYARRLSPENTSVLGLLGAAADELGRTRQALDALEACVRIQGLERAGADVTGRLGAIYLRLGRFDDAIRLLRYAQGPVAVPDNAVAAVQLATALAARGKMADAIDVLGNALPPRMSYPSDPLTLVGFALAVQYDRDEQPAAAFEALDKLRALLQQEVGAAVQRAISLVRFAPAEDEYYYRALLYEVLGHYAEARTEWLLYASVSDAAWRPRALAHAAALDAERRIVRPPPAAPSPPPRTLVPVP